MRYDILNINLITIIIIVNNNKLRLIEFIKIILYLFCILIHMQLIN